MFGLAGQVEQHRESGGTFDQCADCGAAKSDDQVALPVSRNRSVRVLKDAELPAFRVYDCRHTFASRLLAAGAPISYVAAQLGHARPSARSGQ